MAGNYEKSIYNQLIEVMARLDTVEADLLTEKTEHKDDVHHLNAKIDGLTQENQLLRNDNARLKSIIDNDSSDTSLPPSSNIIAGKPANTFNGREKTKKKVGGKLDIKAGLSVNLILKKKSNLADANAIPN